MELNQQLDILEGHLKTAHSALRDDKARNEALQTIEAGLDLVKARRALGGSLEVSTVDSLYSQIDAKTTIANAISVSLPSLDGIKTELGI